MVVGFPHWGITIRLGYRVTSPLRADIRRVSKRDGSPVTPLIDIALSGCQPERA